MIEIKVDAAQMRRVVTFLQFRNVHTATLLSELGAKIVEQHRRRVLSEKTSPDGAAWAPWKPGTRNHGPSILVRTGAMAAAWTTQLGATQVKVGNSKFYLAFHQSGTRKMVARPVMGFSAANLTELEVIVKRFVASAIGAA